MARKRLVAIVFCLSVLEAAGGFLFARSRSWRYDSQPGITSAGISGNAVVLDPHAPGISPAVGARGFIIGDGTTWGENMPHLMTRLGAQGLWGYRNDGSKEVSLGHAQFKGGAGRMEDNRVYYMPMLQWDYDGVVKNRTRHENNALLVGAELGKEFRLKNLLMFIGVNSGMGFIWATNGKEVVDGETQHRDLTRAGFAAGTSITGRWGSANEAGTVLWDGSAMFLPQHGSRADVGVDVNITEHIQVGGGVRLSHVFDGRMVNGSQRKDLIITQPFMRVTLNNQGPK